MNNLLLDGLVSTFANIVAAHGAVYVALKPRIYALFVKVMVAVEFSPLADFVGRVLTNSTRYMFRNIVYDRRSGLNLLRGRYDQYIFLRCL